MNTTGCPPGWATDQIVFYENKPLACDLAVNAWIAMGAILIFAKLLTAIGHSHLWYSRNKAWRERKVAKRKHRSIPFVPILSWIQVCCYLGLFILPAYNLASTENGITAFFFGMGWLVYGLLSAIFLMKFVRLGARILPRKARTFTKPYNESLRRLDTKGKLSLGLQFLAIGVQTFVLCVLGPVFPNHNFVIRVAAGLHAWYTAQHGITMFIHFERVKAAIRQVKDADVASENDLQSVLTRLNEQEFFVVMLNLIGCILYVLISSAVINPNYYIIAIFLWMDMVCFVSILFSNYKAVWHADRMKRIAKSAGTALVTTEPKCPQLKDNEAKEIVVRERALSSKSKKRDGTVEPSSKHDNADDVDDGRGRVLSSSIGHTNTQVVSKVPSDTEKGSLTPLEEPKSKQSESSGKGFLARLTSADRGVPAAYMEGVEDVDGSDDDDDDLDLEEQQTSSVRLDDSSRAIVAQDSSEKMNL